MNENEIMNETVTTEVENPVVETQETELTTSSDAKSLAKDLGEMAVVGLIIYAFCKAVDWVIDKIKAGIRKFKAEKAAKKAAQQQEQPTQAPVATPQTPAEGTETQQ